MRMCRLGQSIAVGIATVVTLSGCSTTISGDATAPSSVGQSSEVPLPPGLDTGEYSARLYPPPQGDGDSQWIAEGNRMLEMLVLPSEVDKRLTEPVKDRDAVPVVASIGYELLPKSINYIATDAEVGVMLSRADRADSPATELATGAIRYRDPDAAKEAVTMATSTFKGEPAVTISTAPESASVQTGVGTVDSLIAVGELVLFVHARASSTAAATTLVERAYARQLPATKRFAPTPISLIPSLPLDDNGILARAVGAERPSAEAKQWAGALTWPVFLRRNPDATIRSALEDAGVDRVGSNLTVLFRTRDPAAATAAFARYQITTRRTPVAGIDALGDAVRCGQTPGAADDVQCVTKVGRYIAFAHSVSAEDARQRIAAQWIILTRNP